MTYSSNNHPTFLFGYPTLNLKEDCTASNNANSNPFSLDINACDLNSDIPMHEIHSPSIIIGSALEQEDRLNLFSAPFPEVNSHGVPSAELGECMNLDIISSVEVEKGSNSTQIIHVVLDMNPSEEHEDDLNRSFSSLVDEAFRCAFPSRKSRRVQESILGKICYCNASIIIFF